MKTFVKETKRKSYLNFNNEIYSANHDFNDFTLKLVDLTKLQLDQQKMLNELTTWVEIGDFETVEEAYFFHLENLKNEAAKKSEEAREWRADNEKLHAERWEYLKSLSVIPATAENIRTLLRELNMQNWGSWVLPKLSIGYKCAQYNCDGTTATTITLDKPIQIDEFSKPASKFEYGAPFGHLNNYHSI